MAVASLLPEGLRTHLEASLARALRPAAAAPASSADADPTASSALLVAALAEVVAAGLGGGEWDKARRRQLAQEVRKRGLKIVRRAANDAGLRCAPSSAPCHDPLPVQPALSQR